MRSCRLSRAIAGVLACMAASACQRLDTDVTTAAIRDGQPTSDHPEVVAIALARSACGAPYIPACTGVLIAPRVVLTAAHCVLGADTDRYEIYFGSNASTDGVMLRGGARHHPSYDPVSHDFDFGVVVLDEVAPAAPVPLSTTLPSVGASLMLVGFGVVDLTHAPDGLKRAGTATLSAVESNDLRMTPSPSMSCNGDSGGPVFAGAAAELVGITSWGDSACESFGVAGRVDSALDFVQPIIDEAAAPPAARTPIADGTDLCRAPCASDDECPTGTVCQRSTDGQFCELPGFGRGVIGEACAPGDGCPYCVRVTSDQSDGCRCIRLCTPAAPPMHAGCSTTAGASPALNGVIMMMIALSLCLIRRRGS
jgi:hypothetical protein